MARWANRRHRSLVRASIFAVRCDYVVRCQGPKGSIRDELRPSICPTVFELIYLIGMN